MQHKPEYLDRQEAGEHLADSLCQRGWKPSIVLALPKGGVPVACPIAVRTGLPLNILIVNKIRHPSYPEVAIGALSESGSALWQDRVREEAGLSDKTLEKAESLAQSHLYQRIRSFRGCCSKANLKDQAVLLVDDGIATGMTMEVAVWSAKEQGASKIYIAAPVSARGPYERLQRLTDGIHCPTIVQSFRAVAEHYVDFEDAPLDQVLQLLQAREPREKWPGTRPSSP